MALAHPRMVRILQLLVLCGTLAQGAAHAGLFDDEEARKAILELRQRVEAGRQATVRSAMPPLIADPTNSVLQENP
jgi:hypothetical protein